MAAKKRLTTKTVALPRRRGVTRGQLKERVIMEKRPIGSTAQAIALTVLKTASMAKCRVEKVA
jgi:hypothetical protein